jgi:hypothetical protein
MPNAQNNSMLTQQKKFLTIQNTETHNTLLEYNGFCQNKKTKKSYYSFHVRQNTSILLSFRAHKRATLLTSSFHYLANEYK